MQLFSVLKSASHWSLLFESIVDCVGEGLKVSWWGYSKTLLFLLWTVPLVSENRTKSTRVAWEWLGNGSQSLTLFGWFISVFKGKHKAMVLLLFYLHLSNITFHEQLLFCPVWKVQLWIITAGFGFFFSLFRCLSYFIHWPLSGNVLLEYQHNEAFMLIGMINGSQILEELMWCPAWN